MVCSGTACGVSTSGVTSLSEFGGKIMHGAPLGPPVYHFGADPGVGGPAPPIDQKWGLREAVCLYAGASYHLNSFGPSFV